MITPVFRDVTRIPPTPGFKRDFILQLRVVQGRIPGFLALWVLFWPPLGTPCLTVLWEADLIRKEIQ